MFYWRVLPNWLKFIRKVKHGNLSSVNSNKWVILTFDLYFHTPTIIKKFPWCVEFEMVIMYDTCNFAMYWKQFAEKNDSKERGMRLFRCGRWVMISDSGDSYRICLASLFFMWCRDKASFCRALLPGKTQCCPILKTCPIAGDKGRTHQRAHIKFHRRL